MTKINNYWLVKSEPGSYSFEQLVKDGSTSWDGVRNYAARNNLNAMKMGDLVLFYHSNIGLEIVGVAKVVKESYKDPTSNQDTWTSVGLVPVKALKNPVKLEALKKDPFFDQFALIRNSRLSVMPVKAEEYQKIIEYSNTK
jgi:predicted RNA-binding protein with PUA-like domain